MDMKRFSILFYPLAIIYGVLTSLRNYFFDSGFIKSYQIKQPSIGVGNLSVGGTGKTILVDYLISQFKKKYNTLIVSRGYKRETNGVVFASKKSTAKTIGDEPYQLFSKHNIIALATS